MKSSVVVSLLALVVSASGRDLPGYIQLCKRTEPNFNECFRRATVAIQPHLSKGIMELNIPPFEPLIVPMVQIEQGTSAVNYKATIHDLKLYGMSNYKFKNVMADFFNSKTLRAKVEIPKIDLVGDYTIKGNVLILPIQGNGVMVANITNCVADVTTTAEIVKKKGEDYLITNDVKIKLAFGGAKAHFDNLFNGDPVLGMTTNNFLNENVKDILEEVKPALEAVTSMLIENIINKIFRTNPIDKLFPK